MIVSTAACPRSLVEDPQIAVRPHDGVVLILNAAASLPGINGIAEATAAKRIDAVFALNIEIERLQRDAVRAWTRETQRTLAAWKVPLITFNSDLALANGARLPRRSGLSQIAPWIHLVTRYWSMRDTTGMVRLLIAGPTAVPSLPGFYGSLWSQDLLSESDVEETLRAPGLIGDFDFEASTQPVSAYAAPSGSPWRTASPMAKHLLDRARPRLVWCRSAVVTPAGSSPIHVVKAGHVQRVDLNTLTGSGSLGSDAYGTG